MARVKNTDVLDSILVKKEAGFLDGFRPSTPNVFFPPLVSFAGAQSKRDKLQATKRRETELWHQWNSGGRKPEDIQPLYDSFKPAINRRVRDFSSAPIPTSTIRHEMEKQFVKALKTYDPNKGTLGTWVHGNLRKGSRFVKTYQNIGKIPEGQIKLFTPYNQAVEELTTTLGRTPDTNAIAEHMGESPKRIAQLQKEMRSDLVASQYMQDPAEVLNPKELEALTLIQYDLSPEERTVYEYIYGLNGKPSLKPGEIAKTAKMHPSKVSRIKNKLKGKVLEAMEVL